jgi:hypothetical protein
LVQVLIFSASDCDNTKRDLIDFGRNQGFEPPPQPETQRTRHSTQQQQLLEIGTSGRQNGVDFISN